MRRFPSHLAIVAILTLTLAGCASAGGRTWTIMAPSASPGAAQPTIAPAGQLTSADRPAPAASAAPAGAADRISIEAFDLGFKPSMPSVPAAGTYEVEFHNTGSTLHDLTFADGTKISAESGKTVTGSVTIPAGGLSFICSIAGHAQAGMKGEVMVSGAAVAADASPAPAAGATGAAPVADPNAPKYTLFPAIAPEILQGTVHDIVMPIIDRDITVAEGFVVHAWTFGGQVPGPTIRVHLGDTVNVHLTNQASMSHSIDFHASQTAMNHQMVEIKPGGTFTYTFHADYAGVWMYHCGTAPALHHIANGM
jgi:nitrite reductase (NO-forming)